MKGINGTLMAGPEAKTKIRWDESTARKIHADVCTVTESREEISVLFGTEQTGHPAGQAETIQLTNRIILSPFAAKQLAAALERVMRDYESTFGTLKKTAPRSTEVDRKEKSAALFRLVKELDVEIGLEHSFKVLEKTMLKNRFMLGVTKKEI